MHFEEIEKQVAQWIKTINIEEFCKNVTKGTKEEQIFKQKPGFDFLSDKNKENYIANMFKYFEWMLKTRKTDELELKDLFIRKLVELTITNREYDFFLFHQVDIKLLDNVDLRIRYLKIFTFLGFIKSDTD